MSTTPLQSTTCLSCGASLSGTETQCKACGERSAPAGYAAQRRNSPETSASFLSSLFDVSFRHMITAKIIRLLYMALMLVAGTVALVFIGAGFHIGSGVGLLALLVSPIPFLLVLAYARVGLEIVVVAFRIEEHLAAIRAKSGLA